MYIVLGGTGHVGSAVAETLLGRGDPVTIVARDPGKAGRLRARGAEVASVDVNDVDALRAVLRKGRRAFLLNPPADTSTDTDAAERASVATILSALEGSGLEKVVAASTYGAQPGEHNGDLGPLHALEQGLAAQSIPALVQRGAYYMSNWDMQLETVRETGKLQSFLPAEFVLPMVDPHDLGVFAAQALAEPVDHAGLRHVEGPRRYSPADVATAMAQALDRPVEVEAVPREAWQQAMEQMGFSPAAAKSYACMTAITVDGAARPEAPLRGPTTLGEHIKALP